MAPKVVAHCTFHLEDKAGLLCEEKKIHKNIDCTLLNIEINHLKAVF